MKHEDLDFVSSEAIRRFLISSARNKNLAAVDGKCGMRPTDISRLCDLSIIARPYLSNETYRLTKHGLMLAYQLWSRSNCQNSARHFEILRKMQLDKNRKLVILDAGCGSGAFLLSCLMYDARLIAMGVDLGFISLQFAKKDLHADGQHRRALLGRGDIHSLPYKDNAFDAIVDVGTLGYLNIARALSEYSRVLRPGGKLFLRVPGFARHLIAIVRCRKILDIPGSIRESLSCCFAVTNGVFFAITGRQLTVKGLKGRIRRLSFTVTGLRKIFHQRGMKIAKYELVNPDFALNESFLGSSRYLEIGCLKIPKYYDIIAVKQ